MSSLYFPRTESGWIDVERCKGKAIAKLKREDAQDLATGLLATGKMLIRRVETSNAEHVRDQASLASLEAEKIILGERIRDLEAAVLFWRVKAEGAIVDAKRARAELDGKPIGSEVVEL